MPDQSSPDFLDELARAIAAQSRQIDRMETRELEARLGMSNPARDEAALGAPMMTPGMGPYEPSALIQAGAIIAGSIAAGAITADKLTVGASSAASLVQNHSFEDALNGLPVAWAPYDNGGTSTAFSETSAAGIKDGALAFTLQANAGAGNRASYVSALFPVRPGEVLFGSAWYRFSATATSGAYFRILYFKADGTASATPSTDVISNAGGTTGVYNEGNGYLTVPADATQAAVVVYLYQPNVTTFLSWDKIIVQRMTGGVLNSDQNVAINAAGITVTNGKIVVSNAGATVIIDGTSNMFKIAATGSLSKLYGITVPVVVTNSVTLTGLGTYSVLPFMVANASGDDTAGHAGGSGPGGRGGHTTFGYTGTTTTEEYRTEIAIDFTSTTHPATVQILLRSAASAAASPGVFTAAACRYYVLIEAGI